MKKSKIPNAPKLSHTEKKPVDQTNTDCRGVGSSAVLGVSPLSGWTSSGRLPEKFVLTMWDKGVMHEHQLDQSSVLLLVRTLLRGLPVGINVNYDELVGDLKVLPDKAPSEIPLQ